MSNDYMRELSSAINQYNAESTYCSTAVGNVVGFGLLAAVGLWVLWALFKDCGGMTC